MKFTELSNDFGSFENALAELRRRADIPWNENPNLAPCKSWQVCGRKYVIAEYDNSITPVEIGSTGECAQYFGKGVEWEIDFDRRRKAAGSA